MSDKPAGDRSRSACEQLDLGRSWSSFLRTWGPAILLIVLGSFLSEVPRWPMVISEIMWVVGIGWSGTGCVRNALRCGRFHCSVLGIVHPLLALLALSITLHIVSMQWNTFWFIAFAPITIVAFIPELFGITYIGSRARAAGNRG